MPCAQAPFAQVTQGTESSISPYRSDNILHSCGYCAQSARSIWQQSPSIPSYRVHGDTIPDASYTYSCAKPSNQNVFPSVFHVGYYLHFISYEVHDHK
jgi:hypothetical protein